MSYTSEVIADSPLAYWRLNNTADSSGNGRSFSTIGLNFGGASLIYNDANASASLPGNTGQRGHVDHLSSGGWPEGIRTLEAWVKPSSVSGDRIAVTRGWSDGSNAHAMQIGMSGNQMFGQIQLSTSTYYTVFPADTFTVGQIIHIVLTFDGSNALLYLNGVLKGTTPASGTLKTASWAAVTLGAYSSGNAATEWNGLLDEVAVYGGVLSAPRVAAHYAAGIPPRLFAGWGVPIK